MDNLEYLNQYYQNYDEDGCFLSHNGVVEFWTTMRYIAKYLTLEARILNISA